MANFSKSKLAEVLSTEAASCMMFSMLLDPAIDSASCKFC